MKEEFRRRSKSTSAIPDVRLAVTGSRSVGKSAISVRFLTRRFIGEYQRNVENTYRRNIKFGNETIEYDLKDAAGVHDNATLVNWATCIAIIYSITDRASFTAATAYLDDIHAIIHLQSVKYQFINQSMTPCLALIGNKKDLEHLREVPSDEGRDAAKKYGVAFWEISASQDYHSTHGPLNSLIVESYLNSVTAKNTDNNSNPSSATNSKKGHEESKPRTKSDTWVSLERCSIDSEFEDLDYRRTLVNKKSEEDAISVTSSSSLKDIKKKRKTFTQELRKNSKLDAEDKSRKISLGKLSLDAFPVFDDNNNIDSPDARYETLSFDNPPRSNSWSQKDKKRSSIRKSTDNKTGTTPKSTLTKSRSYSDLKSWEREQEGEISKQRNPQLSRVKQLANEIDKHGTYKERNLTEQDIVTPGALLSPGEKSETASFSKLSSFTKAKSPRLASKPKRERTIIALPLEDADYDSNSSKSPEYEKAPQKLKRNENKKSVRRKISAIFRPKIIVEGV